MNRHNLWIGAELNFGTAGVERNSDGRFHRCGGSAEGESLCRHPPC